MKKLIPETLHDLIELLEQYNLDGTIVNFQMDGGELSRFGIISPINISIVLQCIENPQPEMEEVIK